ncbi:hypothetical protein [Pelosinus propionicus]|uniref:Uncharacterized protein n=1 Tax=Pelosinus propionicus DSM 13327 TaxID=1123291 RepID=A0A1I4N1G3_9FIRM|nr:hypothetical protein [Pelosinus propionicus]SFM09359.1 hypothetical protein SAMN04490355_104035 [Pelosinus propionicus DSM 13327]
MTYDPNTLPEYISEELEAPQLHQLGCKLSNEVARLTKIVGGYEIGFKSAERNYKRSLAKAMVMHKDYKVATIVKAMADNEPYIIDQAALLEKAEVLLIMGKAELEGRDKQYQAVKKLIDLKVQELRTFRG